MSQEKSKAEDYRNISDKLHQTNPDHEALIFYNHVIGFPERFSHTKEESERYLPILRNTLDIDNLAYRFVLHDFLPGKNGELTVSKKQEILEKKYQEIKAELEPKAEYSFFQTDDNILAKQLLEELKKIYTEENRILVEKIREKEYGRPENQINFQSPSNNKTQPEKMRPTMPVSEEYKEIELSEIKPSVETDEEKKIKIERECKKYKEQYEEKRKMLFSNQEKVADFSKTVVHFNDLHIKIYAGTHTPEFIEMQRQLEEIEREIKAEISSKLDDEWENIKLKVDLLGKLNDKITDFLKGNKNFLDGQVQHQEEQREIRYARFANLKDKYIQERQSFNSNKESLEEFSKILKEFIQIADENVDKSLMADFQDKHIKIQESIKLFEKQVAELSVDFFNLDVNDVSMNAVEVQSNKLVELNLEISKILEANKKFLEEKKPKIDEIKAKQKQQKAISELVEKLAGLETKQSRLKEKSDAVVVDIKNNSNELKRVVLQVDKAINDLDLAVKENIKKETPTLMEKMEKISWEKIPLGNFFHAVAQFFAGLTGGEEIARLREEKFQAAGLNNFSEGLKLSINQSKEETTDSLGLEKSFKNILNYQKQIANLLPNSGLPDNSNVNTTKSDLIKSFGDLNAALTARLPMLKTREENVKGKEEVTQEILKTKNQLSSMTDQNELAKTKQDNLDLSVQLESIHGR